MAKYIYNFKIAKNLYEDLKSQATLNRRKLMEEVCSRLERTCIESYGYNNSEESDLSDKIRKSAYRLYIDPDSITTITFDFYISKKMNEIISKIQSQSNINQEIVNRLAYTLIDPFYNQFNKD